MQPFQRYGEGPMIFPTQSLWGDNENQFLRDGGQIYTKLWQAHTSLLSAPEFV